MPSSNNWKTLLTPYAEHPDAALHLAEHLGVLIGLLQAGKPGIPKALAELEEAIDALYDHSDFDRTGRKFFRQHVTGKLKAKDENLLRVLGVKF